MILELSISDSLYYLRSSQIFALSKISLRFVEGSFKYSLAFSNSCFE